MKKLLNLLVLCIFLSLISGCEPDNTDGPDSDVRDKYLGTWLFSETSSSRSVNAIYEVIITKDFSNSSQVLLSNFGGSGATAYGIVTSSKITVPSQTISTDWLVDGLGNYTNSSTMNWSFSITAGGTKEDHTATATLQ
jgi:hypothetical protein